MLSKYAMMKSWMAQMEALNFKENSIEVINYAFVNCFLLPAGVGFGYSGKSSNEARF